MTTIILAEPQMGENIGAAARVMYNFGLEDLRLVAPRDGWPNPKALEMSAGAKHVVEAARVFEYLEDAIADIHYLVAATVRPRDMVKPVLPPDALAATLATREHTAVMFGGERSGLSNSQVALADSIVTIPTNPAYGSLNLAQAVGLVCYECTHSTIMDDDSASKEVIPPLAQKQEVLGLVRHLSDALMATGMYDTIPDKRKKMEENMTAMFLRAGLTSQEVQSMRGMVKALSRN